MNKYLFAAITAAVFFLIFATDSDACNRCGLFGRRCSFAAHAPVHHVAPAAIHHAPDVNNFIFNNSYPGNFLPAGGSSVFGYHNPAGPQGFSLAAQGLYVDPAMVLDRAARLAELQASNSAAATLQFNDSAAKALALNQSSNNLAIAQVAIAAMQQPQELKASALKVSVKSNGETKAEWITPDGTGSPAGGEIKPLGLAGDITLTCAKCHNKPVGQEVPGGFYFDGQHLTRDDLDWAQEAVWSGKMPPNSKLDRAAKSKVVEKLRGMVN